MANGEIATVKLIDFLYNEIVPKGISGVFALTLMETGGKKVAAHYWLRISPDGCGYGKGVVPSAYRKQLKFTLVCDDDTFIKLATGKRSTVMMQQFLQGSIKIKGNVMYAYKCGQAFIKKDGPKIFTTALDLSKGIITKETLKAKL
eukprot:g2562.t1